MSELNYYKQNIDLTDYACTLFGFSVDEDAEPTNNQEVIRGPDGVRLLVAKLPPKYEFEYISEDGKEHGTIVEFSQNRMCVSKSELCKIFKAWVDLPLPSENNWPARALAVGTYRSVPVNSLKAG